MDSNRNYQLQLVTMNIFFNRDSLLHDEQPLRGMELQEKEAQKDYCIQEICLERTYNYKMSVNSRLKTTEIIGQRKAFYRQIIPESSCARKETVDIDILVTSRNGAEKSCNLSEQRVELPREKGSGTS